MGLVDTYRVAHASNKLNDCWICNYPGGTDSMVSLFARALPHSWYSQLVSSSLLRFPPIDFTAPIFLCSSCPLPTPLPPALPLLESELGNFCLEPNGINFASRGSNNIGYSTCNFTIVFDAAWREHPEDTLIRPCNFRTNPKQIILMCDPKVGDTCMFDPWQ